MHTLLQQANPTLSPEPKSQEETVLIPVRLCSLPPFHPVASQLMALPQEEAHDLKRIASIAGGDPAFAAEILFLANSSLFGFPERIQSIRHAVAVLGSDCIRQLAITIAMRSLSRGASPFIRQCWRHSVACAVIAEQIAPASGCTAEQAYTAGLLHDVGRLGFLRTYASEIVPILGKEFEGPDDVLAAERGVMNVDHGEAGAWLIGYWRLPDSLSAACAQHHGPFRKFDSPVLKSVKAACRLATAIGCPAMRYRAGLSYGDVLDEAVNHIRTTPFPREDELAMLVEARLKALDAG